MSVKIEMRQQSEDSICRRYRDGETLRDIAVDYNVSVMTIRRILQDRKIKLRPRGRVPA